MHNWSNSIKSLNLIEKNRQFPFFSITRKDIKSREDSIWGYSVFGLYIAVKCSEATKSTGEHFIIYADFYKFRKWQIKLDVYNSNC